MHDGEGGITYIGTDDTGRGGNLTIHATESISISGQTSQGQSSAIGTSVAKGNGDGGNLFVSTPELLLRWGSHSRSYPGQRQCGRYQAGGRQVNDKLMGVGIFAGTAGDGNAGNIEVRVGKLTLSGGGGIFAGVEGLAPHRHRRPGSCGEYHRHCHRFHLHLRPWQDATGYYRSRSVYLCAHRGAGMGAKSSFPRQS